MSLQVWLPLNGSLENLGLSDTSQISTTNLTFSDNGKIGKCLTGYTGYFNIPSMTGKKQLSVAYWIRINTATDTNWLDAFRWYSTDGSSSYASRNEFYTNSTRTGVWYKGGSLDDAGLTYTVGTWRHHAFTIDYETGEGKFYIDGVLKYTASTVDTTHYLTGTNFMIGENGLDTSHNDLRIYDHCLSPKEVKELSKGLVAHYPLNDGIGGENLVPNQSQYTSESPYVLQTNRTDGYNWLPNSAFEVEPSTQYTFSVCCDGVISNTHGSGGHSPSELPFTTWFYTCIDSTTKDWQHGYYDYARNFTSSYSTFRQEGNRYIWTYTTAANEKYISIRLNGYSDGSTTIQIKFWDFKVEKGSVATPWVPNSNDELYSTMGFDDGVVYDCSGYGHNGAISPTPLDIDSDSVRYLSCMKFNGTNNYIDLGKSTWLPTDQITVSLWAYMDTWKASRLLSCTEGGGFNFEEGSGGGYRFPVNKAGTYIYGTPVKKWASYTTGWHFFTGTFDGYVSKIYIDGEYDSGSADSETKGLIKYNANAKFFIGCEANTASPSAPYFNGKISDVRIYATALSAEDIKELYETSASIDNHGNFYAYEIQEV